MNRYRKGANKERKIVNAWREKGAIAFRSAGSKSPIDVTVIDFENKIIRLIQCKVGSEKYEKYAKKKVEKSGILKLEGYYNVIMEIL